VPRVPRRGARIFVDALQENAVPRGSCCRPHAAPRTSRSGGLPGRRAGARGTRTRIGGARASRLSRLRNPRHDAAWRQQASRLNPTHMGGVSTRRIEAAEHDITTDRTTIAEIPLTPRCASWRIRAGCRQPKADSRRVSPCGTRRCDVSCSRRSRAASSLARRSRR
jgi:hypothetical protein